MKVKAVTFKDKKKVCEFIEKNSTIKILGITDSFDSAFTLFFGYEGCFDE